MNRLYFIIPFLLLSSSCSTGKCREQKKTESQAATAGTEVPPPADLAPTQPGTAAGQKPSDKKTSGTTVKVFKYDGSKQCAEAPGIDLNEMEKDLKGIKVVSKDKHNDGKMRIQMCGADTGQANVYEIQASDLKAALKAGFKEWKN